MTKSQITNNNQTPNNNNQTIRKKDYVWIIGYWNLFGDWKLVIGDLI